MQDRRLVWGMCLGIFVGCASQQLASLSVPAASAQQARDMPRWQYRCFDSDYVDQVETLLNEAGAERWELAANIRAGAQSLICMKRPWPHG